MNTDLPSHLLLEFKALDCFQNRILKSVEPISSGLSQASYKVETTSGSYVVKAFNSASLLANEKRLYTIAANCGFIPNMLVANETYLVTEFIEGQLLFDTNLTKEQKLTTALIAKQNFQALCHNKNDFQPLSLKNAVEALLNRVAINQTVAQGILNTVNQLLSKISDHKNVLSHGDLNYKNIIMASVNSHLWLIDFECVCLAPQAYDIAMLLAVNELIFDFSIETLNDYLIQFFPEILLEDVTRYLVIAIIINGLWYLEQFQRTNNQNWQRLAIRQCCQLALFDLPYETNSDIFYFQQFLTNS